MSWQPTVPGEKGSESLLIQLRDPRQTPIWDEEPGSRRLSRWRRGLSWLERLPGDAPPKPGTSPQGRKVGGGVFPCFWEADGLGSWWLGGLDSGCPVVFSGTSAAYPEAGHVST